jgi:hypothetical protein
MTHGARVNDPYRAEGAGPTFPPIPSGLRVGYLCVALGMAAALVLTIVTFTVAFIGADQHTPPNTALMVAGASSYGLVFVLLFTQLVLGVVWLHKAWSWLPLDQRWTRQWKSWITPEQAAGYMLIPYFHYYWMFVVNLGMCDALERLRVLYPTRQGAPKDIVLIACITQIVFWPVAPIFWLVYMKRVEEMSREMSASAAQRRAAAF